MHLSVSDLISFYRCPRLLFLNHHGDKKLQVPPSDFLKRLWKFGRSYEIKVVDFFKYEKPKYKVGDYETGFKETFELMKKGVETIYQGVLKNDEVVGIPDFLIKCSGNSTFGDYYYYAVDVKGASTSRERYLFQLACYSYLLGDIQGFAPLYGGLLLLDVDLKIKYFYDLMQEVDFAITEGLKILKDNENMPDLFIDSNCQMCQWYNFCLPEAKQKKDLSLVSGVTRKIKSQFINIGVKNYNDLSNCNQNDLAQINGLTDKKVNNVILQAKSLNENKIYLKAIPDLEESNNEIFIDFESDLILNEKGTELTRIDYLIGLLKTSGEKLNYEYLLLEGSEEEFVDKFTSFLKEYSNYTFYHYGHYEQSIFENKWPELPKVKLVNIETVFKNSILIPISSYSLKNIASVIGFKWRNKEASATQSMCWYSSFLETKERKFIDLSIEYNHDDCLALYFIKQWLENLKAKKDFVGRFIDFESFSPRFN